MKSANLDPSPWPKIYVIMQICVVFIVLNEQCPSEDPHKKWCTCSLAKLDFLNLESEAIARTSAAAAAGPLLVIEAGLFFNTLTAFSLVTIATEFNCREKIPHGQFPESQIPCLAH